MKLIESTKIALKIFYSLIVDALHIEIYIEKVVKLKNSSFLNVR